VGWLGQAAYGLNQSKNAEIRFGWYLLALSAEFVEVLPAVVDFVTSQGRMKYVRPMYRALFKSRMGRQLALDTFKEKRGALHPIAQKMVAADLAVRE
jgi:leukotriene-A4 hydrolase